MPPFRPASWSPRAQNDLAALPSALTLVQSALIDTARIPASVTPGTPFFTDPLSATDGNTLQARFNELLAAVQSV